MKTVLTIAGSDSSGGAGIQADLKTFEAFGVFGTSAITVLTAQNTAGVQAIEAVSPEFVAAQLKAVDEDFHLSAIKIGMLFSTPIIKTVEAFIKDKNIPIVIDPVCVSKAGSPLLQDDALEALKELFKYASVITPNQYEASHLFGYESDDPAALAMLMRQPCPILIKNERTEHMSVDQLIVQDRYALFESLHVETTSTHGTGCSYSSAIAANLALAHTLEEAIGIAKRFIYEALIAAPGLGNGPGPINHKQGGLNVANA